VSRASRAQYIRDTYRLEVTKTGWRAVNDASGINRQTGEPWRVFATIEGVDRATVIRKARAHWGHFNFEDECRAFNEVFPPTHNRVTADTPETSGT
jgi:hypothetical protein